MTRTTPLGALAGFVTFAATLYVLYLAVANALLASDWARRQFDREPRIALEWKRAWTLFPGHLTITEPRLSGTGGGRRYALVAERASLVLSPASLLNRQLRLHRLDAEGVRQVRLGAYRLRGSGHLHLSGVVWRDGELAAKAMAGQWERATIFQDDTPLVESVALDADLELAPLALKDHAGSQAARFISGSLDLAGRSDAYDLFNPYLADLGWLQIGGHGVLEVELTVVNGEVQPGSRLRLDSPRLSVQLDERRWLEGGTRYRVDGSGTVEVNVEEHARLALALGAITMRDATPGAASRPALLNGEGFRLTLETAGLHLHAPPDELQHAELRWHDAEAPDIAAFDHYLPPPVPLELKGGSARLQGGLAYDAERLSGSFDLSGDRIALRLGEQPLRGRLDLHLPIAELDVTRGVVNVSGTRLDLEAAAPGEVQPLTTTLALPTARVRAPQAWRALNGGSLLKGDPSWSAELALHGRLANLGVLDPILTELFDGLDLGLEGGGRLSGTLHVRHGQPQEGSRLEVRSEALGARFLGHHARGEGELLIAVQAGEPHPEASDDLAVNDVDLTRLSDARRLFQADHLALTATLPITQRIAHSPTARVTWHDARIPDASVLNAYLPEGVPLQLDGGQASSDGSLTLEEARGRGRISLAGDAIHGRLRGTSFRGALDATLALRDLDPARQLLDFSGSRVEMIASANDGETLRTLLVARQARLRGGLDWPGREAHRRPLAGTLRLDGLLDRLGFLNALLPEEQGLSVQGSGRLRADLHFAEGMPSSGSRLEAHSDRLAARFLHYEAFGDGSLELEVTDPGATLHLSLPRFGLRRQETEGALIEGRLLELRSRARHFGLPEGLRQLSTHIDMPHVVAPDLAAFNAYLPEGGGISLIEGQARLAAQLHLDGMSAAGHLELRAPQARLALHDQILEGELHLATRLADGDLETLTFDISGSRLGLENVHLTDDGGNLTRGWWARLDVPEGNMRWETPLALDARLDLAMRDSGLLVRLLVDAARERRWLRERLTLGEVHGEARVMLNDDTVRVENIAVQAGERLELLANLALRDSHLAGRAFARYGPLRLGIELDGERRRWQLRNARSWYAGGQPASELTLPDSETWFERLEVPTE
ncbi:hypothetical protein HNO51_06030 [Billgrantia sulfidoxydans]|uniref:AsmA-like C-terminal domain-containing protein n=1 Tax=Billgrantia sulfidoxydans TaxID=2733484 RepID=A0ABX7W5J8_9GAMM|nr:hypothetical protein [Halomonas sulfidoxydans]QTP54283.1 hypothetical protein HNO51_06030 [Halomonas sulfidoxydans]